LRKSLARLRSERARCYWIESAERGVMGLQTGHPLTPTANVRYRLPRMRTFDPYAQVATMHTCHEIHGTGPDPVRIRTDTICA
jgi:hypothetical protein